MIIETFILNGNQGLLHVFRDVFILDPDPPLITADVNAGLPFPGKILIPDRTGLTERVVFKRKVQIRSKTGFDIIGKNTGEQCSR